MKTFFIIGLAAILGLFIVFNKKLRGKILLPAFCVAIFSAMVLEITIFNFPYYLRYFAGPSTEVVGSAETDPNILLTSDGTQGELLENGMRFNKLNRKVASIYLSIDFSDIKSVKLTIKCENEKSASYYTKVFNNHRPHDNYVYFYPRERIQKIELAVDEVISNRRDVNQQIEFVNIVINKPIPFYFNGLRLLFVSLLLFVIFSLVNKKLRIAEAALWVFLRNAKKYKLNAVLRYLTLGCAFLLIDGLVLLYYYNTVNEIGGEYIYPLDDTYIHLAVAKNAAFYNNWGVGHDEFSSTSSSPLYTFIISVLMRLFGDNAVYPLLINIFFGNLIIIALYLFIKNKLWFFISIIFCVCPVLLHVQILSGMEHTMHIFMILTAFMLFSKFADSGFNNKKYGKSFLCVSLLLCMSRYESMFFLAPTLVILLLNKRYSFALLTFAAGFLPVLLFGIWSMSNGGFFFPNSLLMKGDIAVVSGVTSQIAHYWGKTYRDVIRNPIFIGAIAMILIIVIQDFVLNKTYNFKAVLNLIKKYAFVFIALTTTWLHMSFAGIGWLFRYEAYLLVLLYLTLILVINKNTNISKNYAVALSIIFIFLSVPSTFDRFNDSHRMISSASKNIHDQQIQMSRFLKMFYNNSNVMANDIGAITYYTDIKLKDLFGLGSNDVLVLRKANNLHTGWRNVAWGGGDWNIAFQKYKQYSVIMIYDSWFLINSDADRKRLGLIRIGELYIKNNVICGGNQVSFYTSDETMVETFRDNMLKFKEMVPKDVTINVF